MISISNNHISGSSQSSITVQKQNKANRFLAIQSFKNLTTVQKLVTVATSLFLSLALIIPGILAFNYLVSKFQRANSAGKEGPSIQGQVSAARIEMDGMPDPSLASSTVDILEEVDTLEEMEVSSEEFSIIDSEAEPEAAAINEYIDYLKRKEGNEGIVEKFRTGLNSIQEKESFLESFRHRDHLYMSIGLNKHVIEIFKGFVQKVQRDEKKPLCYDHEFFLQAAELFEDPMYSNCSMKFRKLLCYAFLESAVRLVWLTGETYGEDMQWAQKMQELGVEDFQRKLDGYDGWHYTFHLDQYPDFLKVEIEQRERLRNYRSEPFNICIGQIEEECHLAMTFTGTIIFRNQF